MRRSGTVLLSGALFLSTGIAAAQQSGKPKNTVLYVAEAQSVAAGKPGVLELHFKVLDGYHVNSHNPKGEYLIPTALTVEPAAGVTEKSPEYSAGHAFSLSFSPGETLDVYTGDFAVKLPVVAAAGTHLMDATLHYQACDRAACYPPKSLPLQVLFTAK